MSERTGCGHFAHRLRAGGAYCRGMAYETVTGYCWPQSVEAGERVALHLSSSGGGRCRSRWHGSVGPARSCSQKAPSPPTTTRRRPTHRNTAATGPLHPTSSSTQAWRSGYYEVLLSIDVDGSSARVERSSWSVPTSPRRRRRSSGRSTPTPGTPTTTSAAATSTPAPPRRRCCDRWPLAICTSHPGRASGSPRSIRPITRARATSAICG